MQYIPYDVSLVVKTKVRNGEKQSNTSEGSEYQTTWRIMDISFMYLLI